LPCSPASNRLRTPTVALPDEVLQQVEMPRTCADSEFEDYLQYLCSFHHFTAPVDADSAIQLYCHLLPFIVDTHLQLHS